MNQPLGNAKIANKSVMNAHSHSDFAHRKITITVSLTTTMVTLIDVGVERYRLQWYKCRVRRHLTMGRGMIIACMQFQKLRCTKV